MKRLLRRVGQIRVFELFLWLALIFFLIVANGKEAGFTALMIYTLARLQSIYD